MNARQLLGVAKQAVSQWNEDRAPSMGAALSYYTVFSIAPLLLIVISVAGLVFGTEAAQGAIVGQLQGLLGERAAQTIEELLKSVSEPKEGALGTAIGAVLLLLGATTVLAELQADLDRIWDAPEREHASGLWGWLRARLLSFAMILGLGFLLLVSLVASAAIAALGDWWGPLFGGWEVLAHVVNFVVSFVLISVLFAFIYRFLPQVRIAWHDVWFGAAVTALLFSIGKQAIGLYIGKSDVVSGFGAAGSLVVLLLWVYYSSQVFLLGAEFTRASAQAYGSRSGEARGAAPAVAGQGAATGAAGNARVAPAGPSTPPARPSAAPAGGVAAATTVATGLGAPAAAPAGSRRPGALAQRIQRSPLSAIGMAAALGVLTSWWLRRRQARAPAVRHVPRWGSVLGALGRQRFAQR